MRLLCVHADSIAFEAGEQARADEDVESDGVPMDGHMTDCVVVFVGVEPGDREDIDGNVDAACAEIADVTGQLDITNIVLYPCAQLVDDVAAPDIVDAVMAELEASLHERAYDVLRAPDGWYKHLDLSAKGHRFARRSVHVTPAPDERAAGDASEWLLLFPDRTCLDATEATAEVSDTMAAFVEHELGAMEPTTVCSRQFEPMREAGFVTAATDRAGDDAVVYTPCGSFLRTAVQDYVTDRIIEYGAMPIETASASSVSPIAAMQTMALSATDLPLRFAESTNDPEIHTAVTAGDQAREEMRQQVRLTLRTTENLGLTVTPVVRMQHECYEKHETWVQRVVSDLDRPVLLELLSGPHRSWTVRIELPTVDSNGRPIACPTVTLDRESANRHHIEYTDGSESERPSIVHCSPAGRIDHVAAALVTTATRMETAQLPTWLSPTQVRLVPVVPEDHLSFSESLADDLERGDVRVDVDDRAATVGERIESAQRDWVPYYAVVGDDELDGETLGVTVRAENREVEMASEELRERVLDDIDGRPRNRRYLPRRVSDQPEFVE